jgi:hypothetical protein
MIKLKSDSEPVNVLKLLKDNSFRIPRYQRPYKWGIEQWEEFYGKFDKQEAYIGTFFFYEKNKNNGNEIEVIDGQQRLTTFFLFLKACQLHMLNKNYRNNKYLKEVNNILFSNDKNNIPITRLIPQDIYDSKDNFSKLMLSDKFPRSVKTISDEIKKKQNTNKNSVNELKKELKDAKIFFKGQNEADRNYKNGLLFFYEKIYHLDINVINNNFLFLINKIFCLRLSTSQQKDIYNYFNNINATGLKLDKEDIIKNSFFEIDRSVEDKDIEAYEDVCNKLGFDLSMDDFLYYQINSRFDLNKEFESYKNENNLITKKHLIDAFKKLIKEKSSKEVIKSLVEDVDEYIEINNPKNKWNYEKDKYYYYFVISQFYEKKAISFILKVIKKKPNNADFIKILKVVTYIIVKHSILGKEPKKLESIFGLAGKEITTSKINTKFVINSLISSSTYKEKIELKDFGKYHWNNSQSTALNLLLDMDQIKKDAKLKGTQLKVKFSLEHIFPKNPDTIVWHKPEILDKLFSKGEPKIEEIKLEFEKYSRKIGNHVILNESTNPLAGNFSFEIKRPIYYNSAFTLTKKISSKPIWNQTEIDKRDKMLFTRFEKLKIIS